MINTLPRPHTAQTSIKLSHVAPVVVIVVVLLLCSWGFGGSHSAAVLALDVERGVDAARLGAEDVVDVHPAMLTGLHLQTMMDI